MTKYFNDTVKTYAFPSTMKLFKKNDTAYLILSKNQCSFRKGYSSQHCLVAMIEKLKKSLNSKGSFRALLTDLSKAFDCIPHELTIAKLDTYVFDLKALILVFNYFRNRKQRAKINSSYSDWSDLLFGVPQGSILGLLLFIIFICDLFYFEENVDLASYADDNVPYCASLDIQTTINTLQDSSAKLFDWFSKNSMKANADKRHFLQLNALARISGYMDSSKKGTIMKAFITSHFSYCPLVWMFHSREINNKINRIHERSLRLVYSDKTCTFKELLDTDKSVSVHHKNMQVLGTEIYETVNGLAPTIMNSIFEIKNIESNLRNKNNFKSRRIDSVRCGIDSLTYLGPKIWNIVPEDIKKSKSLNVFKTKIKKWILGDCPCRLCRQFIQNLGYIYLGTDVLYIFFLFFSNIYHQLSSMFACVISFVR